MQPVRWLVSRLISSAGAGLLWEENIVGCLISPGWNQQTNRLIMTKKQSIDHMMFKLTGAAFGPKVFLHHATNKQPADPWVASQAAMHHVQGDKMSLLYGGFRGKAKAVASLLHYWLSNKDFTRCLVLFENSRQAKIKIWRYASDILPGPYWLLAQLHYLVSRTILFG